MLLNAYVWDNEMVMAFDENGQQIPELQGPVKEVAVKLLQACTPETTIRGGCWRETKARMREQGAFER